MGKTGTIIDPRDPSFVMGKPLSVIEKQAEILKNEKLEEVQNIKYSALGKISGAALACVVFPESASNVAIHAISIARPAMPLTSYFTITSLEKDKWVKVATFIALPIVFAIANNHRLGIDCTFSKETLIEDIKYCVSDQLSFGSDEIAKIATQILFLEGVKAFKHLAKSMNLDAYKAAILAPVAISFFAATLLLSYATIEHGMTQAASFVKKL